VWEQLQNFTTSSTYFGHEITDILDLQQSLLYRQDNESKSFNGSAYLKRWANSTLIGTSILNDLIINEKQWNQIESVNLEIGFMQQLSERDGKIY